MQRNEPFFILVTQLAGEMTRTVQYLFTPPRPSPLAGREDALATRCESRDRSTVIADEPSVHQSRQTRATQPIGNESGSTTLLRDRHRASPASGEALREGLNTQIGKNQFGLLGLLLIVILLSACNLRPADEATDTPPAPEFSAAFNESIGLSNEPTDAIETRDYRLGPEDAPVTFVMYGDFQCVRCGRYARDLEILRSEFPDELQIIWRHLPDTQSHDKAGLALQAAEAAAAQGRFWDMHAMLFTTQDDWQALDPDAFRAKLSEYAAIAGLDVPQFEAAIDDGRYAPLVEEYQEQAETLDIVGIPSIIINGEPLNDRDDLFGLRGAIQLALLRQRGYDSPPEMQLVDGVDYHAEIVTDQGTIRLDLFEEQAPIAVNNFVFLAREGWYDGQTFFLVVPEFYAQAGDPSETGRGNAGYHIPGEHDNGLVFDKAGLVAMSHPPGELDGAGSQFFITMASLPEREAEWDGQFTIFGQVTEGLNVVENLTPRNPGDPLRFPNPPPGDTILRVTIEER